MRIALIGLGDIAQKAYLPLLASDERVTPLLCTRSPSVLGKLARQYRIAECFTEVEKNLGHPPFCMGRNVTKSHATAHGLQLPICSIDQRGQ
jgi:predicted dehydrogenase